MDQNFENYPRNLIILGKKRMACDILLNCTLITISNQNIQMFTAQHTTVSNLVVYVTVVPQLGYWTLV